VLGDPPTGRALRPRLRGLLRLRLRLLDMRLTGLLRLLRMQLRGLLDMRLPGLL
jgi:hypothetical protein